MVDATHEETRTPCPSDTWTLQRVVTPRTIALLFAIAILAALSAKTVELDKAARETWGAVLSLVGQGESRVVNSAVKFVKDAFPLQFAS